MATFCGLGGKLIIYLDNYFRYLFNQRSVPESEETDDDIMRRGISRDAAPCVERKRERSVHVRMRSFPRATRKRIDKALRLTGDQGIEFFIGAPLISSIEIASGGHAGPSQPIITVDNELQR